ncbi:MAG: TraR/DksA C4-type zinc finger protein [Pararhodobacter sp.]|nr:TraR/DksA C4-type zinc finger protein [Pararhodobacter sp.]
MTPLTTGTLPNSKLARRKAQLIARLKELDVRLHEIEDEFLAHQAKDWEEMATEREQDEALNALGEKGLREIRMIRAALARIEEGEYGFCTKCGVRIPDARLDILPATPFCPVCAR